MKLPALLITAAMIVSVSGAAFAQTPPTQSGRGRFAACRDDMQKYCAGKRGADRRQCVSDNRDKFSDACKTALAARAGSGRGGQ